MDLMDLQGLRRNMEMVIEFMIDSDGRGVKRMYAPTLQFGHLFIHAQSSSSSHHLISTKLE